eukprot:7378927-Prymnesium_polylepis.1
MRLTHGCGARRSWKRDTAACAARETRRLRCSAPAPRHFCTAARLRVPCARPGRGCTARRLRSSTRPGRQDAERGACGPLIWQARR